MLARDSQCGEEAYFFFQIPCVTPAAEHEPREMNGLIIGCIGVFIYLFVIIYIDYVKSVQKNKYVEYDLNTITAGDYTVEFDISQKFYDEFVKNYHDKTNPTPEALQLKLYIKAELERRLTEMPG